MLINSPNISGSLRVTGNAVITGSLTVLGGINATITGSVTSASYVEYSNVANKPTLVSGSTQVSFNGITDKPTLISGSTQVSFNGITDKPTLVSGSSQITYSGLSGIPSGIVSGSSQVTALGFATTGSNTFQANQTITGSLFITQNLVVAGSSSIQYISSSVLDIADNIITVNAFNPGVRFGGLAVIDSGSSPQVSGSLLFDSIKDQWIFVHQNQSVVTSSVLLMGPETYNDLGNESYISANRLPKGSGVEHLRDSNITDTGTVVSVNSNTAVTGSFTVVTGSAVELQVTNLGVNIGSALTDSHIISGSLRVNPNGLFVSGSGNVGIGTTSPDVFSRGDERNVGISVPGASDNLALALNAGGSAGRGAQIYMGQGGTRHFTISSNATETRVGTATSTPLILTTNDTTRLTISSTGIATFTGTTVAANGSVNIESTDPAIRFRYTGGTANSRIYEWRAVAAGGVNDIMQLRLWNDAQSSATTLMTVSPTGAGTFASSVTVGTDIILSAANPFIYGGTAAGGVGMSNIGGQTYIRVYGASHATSANVTQFVNAGNTSLSISSTGAATFSSSVTATSLLATTWVGAQGTRISSAPSVQGVYLGNSGTTSGDFATIEMVGGTGGGSEIDFTVPNSDRRGRVGYNNTTNYMWFETNDGTEKIRITSGGNVGIGTSSPTEGLVVSTGALRVTSQALDFGAGTRGISIDTTGAGLGRIYTVSGTGTATDLAFGTNNTERMRIMSGGAVGIGQSSGGTPLRATLVKQGTTSVTFTATVGTIGAWRPGHAMIKVSGGQNGLQEYWAAWFYVRIIAYFASSAICTVVDSGGDTSSVSFSSTSNTSSPQTVTFTLTDSGGTTNTMIADIDLTYNEGIVSLS